MVSEPLEGAKNTETGHAGRFPVVIGEGLQVSATDRTASKSSGFGLNRMSPERPDSKETTAEYNPRRIMLSMA